MVLVPGGVVVPVPGGVVVPVPGGVVVRVVLPHPLQEVGASRTQGPRRLAQLADPYSGGTELEVLKGLVAFYELYDVHSYFYIDDGLYRIAEPRIESGAAGQPPVALYM